jgi:hypothetical protein
MFGLEDEVVLLARTQAFRDRRAGLEATRSRRRSRRVGAPAAAVVVDEHGRHAGLVAAPLEGGDAAAARIAARASASASGKSQALNMSMTSKRRRAGGASSGERSAFGSDRHDLPRHAACLPLGPAALAVFFDFQEIDMKETNTRTDANRDPITDAVGSHPVGTGLGALAVARRLVRRQARWPARSAPSSAPPSAPSSAVSPARASPKRSIRPRKTPTGATTTAAGPMSTPSASYDDYGPAYAYGVNSYSTYAGRDWDDVEPELSGRWDTARGSPRSNGIAPSMRPATPGTGSATPSSAPCPATPIATASKPALRENAALGRRFSSLRHVPCGRAQARALPLNEGRCDRRRSADGLGLARRFKVPAWELILRGSAMYWLLFLFFRLVLRRDVGAVGVADVLLVVLIADASQNAMTGGYDSVAEGAVLVATLIGWNLAIDWMAFRFPWAYRLVEPRPLLVIRAAGCCGRTCAPR